MALKRLVKGLIEGGLATFGYEARIRKRGTPHALWDQDAEFVNAYRALSGRTLVDVERCHILSQLARHASTLPGDFAEIGVYKGGTARLLAPIAASAGKTLHLLDTFSGMPETDPQKDIHVAGHFSDTSLASVQSFLSSFNNVRFHPGFFPATAEPIRDLTFSFVHVDVDIYQSVKDCCEFFHARMPDGGILIFDDYGFESCPGAKLAVDEFFRDRAETPCYLQTGQCLVVVRKSR